MTWISVDFRFLEIGYELWALNHMLDVSEQQIVYLRDQDTIRTYSRLHHDARQGDQAEDNVEIEMLRDRVDVVIPRFLRYPVLVSAWAVYEAGVTEVARYIADHRHVKLKLSDSQGDDFLARATHYFTAELKVELDPDIERKKRLKHLVTVRHAIVHTDGRVAMLKQKSRDSIKRMAIEGIGISISEGFIIVEQNFVRNSVAAATESIAELVDRAKAH